MVTVIFRYGYLFWIQQIFWRINPTEYLDRNSCFMLIPQTPASLKRLVIYNIGLNIKIMSLFLSSCLSGKNWVKIDQLPVAPAPTSMSEGRDLEVKGENQEPSDALK